MTALLMVTLVPISEDGSTERLTTTDLRAPQHLCSLLYPATPTTDRSSVSITRVSSHINILLSDVDRNFFQSLSTKQQQPNAAHTQSQTVDGLADNPELSAEKTATLLAAFNSLLESSKFFDKDVHAAVDLAREGETLKTLASNGTTLTAQQNRRLNRLILEATFPDNIRKMYVDGWRPVMYIYGAIGFLVAALYWLVVRNHPSEHPGCHRRELEMIEEGRNTTPNAKHVADGGAPVMQLIKSFSMWCDCFMQTGTNIAWVFLVTWLPRYLRDVHEVPIEQRGLLAGIPLAAGVVGMLMGGKATDILTSRVGLKWGRRLPLFATKISGAAAYGCCLFFSTLPETSPYNSAVAYTVCFCVVSFSVDFGNPANWAFKQDVGGRHVGSVLGWATCGATSVLPSAH